jgi:hypothetical protein
MLEAGTYIRDILSSRIPVRYTDWKPTSAGWIYVSDYRGTAGNIIRVPVILQKGKTRKYKRVQYVYIS